MLLNLAPDHLDHHGSFEAYASAKARIFANQSGDDVHVGNRDDPDAAALSASAPCAVVWFRLGEPAAGEVGIVGGRLVARLGADADLGPIAGDRTGAPADAAAAAAAALAFGVEPGAIVAGLAAYEPEPHRGEVVARAGGVRFMDNSKATNVHAALAAIDGVRDAVLIAGGRAKGQDLSLLGTRSDRLAGVVAIGETADDVAQAFEGRLPVRKAGSIEEAVRTAFELAPAPGGRAAGSRLRQLGSVRRLPGTRRPVRRGGACHRRGGGRRWLIVGPARRGGRAAPAAPSRAAAPMLRVIDGRDDRRSAKDRARLARVDLILLVVAAGFLTAVGLVMVLSAGSVSAAQGYGGNSFWYFERQVALRGDRDRRGRT